MDARSGDFAWLMVDNNCGISIAPTKQILSYIITQIWLVSQEIRRVPLILHLIMGRLHETLTIIDLEKKKRDCRLN